MDNLSRFQNLTGINPNIAQYGNTVEEIQAQKGSPDPDPVASPMPATSGPNALLALTPAGSDRLRLQGPESPPVNPFTGATHTLFLNRNALLKLDGAALTRLGSMVRDGKVGTAQTRSLMGDSIARVDALKAMLGSLAAMAMSVVVQTRAVARG